MDQGPLGYILVLALSFQLAAAVLAINLVWVTGRRLSWLLFAAALSLMAYLRAVAVYGYFYDFSAGIFEVTEA